VLNQLRKIRLIIKGVLSSLLYKIIHHNGFDPKQTILIFGSIRSGSTWLAEVLSSIDGHLQVFEPLHPDYVPDIKKMINNRNPYIPADQNWPKGYEIFTKIISGKLINSWTMSQSSLKEVLNAKRLVVKFVRGNLLLEWLCTNMDVKTPVLVIRHPCAIIASQINKGWPPDKRILLDNPYLDQYPKIRSDCECLSKPEELAALAWCLRYHAPLMSSKPYPFIIVTYENMVKNGKQELERIFTALKIPLDDKAIARLSVPSDTVTNTSQVVSGKDPLAGWKYKLTDSQVDTILAVLKIFDMDFYTKELEPDYEKLLMFGSRSINE
jgi:hypothetical protein